MYIKIDEIKYHLNLKDTKATKFVKSIFVKLLENYPYIEKMILENFKNHKISYTSKEQMILLKNVILAISKEISDTTNKIDEKDFLFKVKNELLKVLPIIFHNETDIKLNSYFIYEPKNAYSYYLLRCYRNHIVKYLGKNKEIDEDKSYYLLLINNIVRSLKSSLLMFASGDDVHGVSILRGTLELYARFLSLNESNFEYYKEHVKLNAELQNFKMKNQKVDESSPKLLSLMKDKNLHGAALEMYLLNSWCKNENGKLITSNSDMIEHAFSKDVTKFYNYASEFVHEDYLGVDYDYIFIRKNCKNLINQISSNLFYNLTNFIHDFSIKEKAVHTYLDDLLIK